MTVSVSWLIASRTSLSLVEGGAEAAAVAAVLVFMSATVVKVSVGPIEGPPESKSKYKSSAMTER